MQALEIPPLSQTRALTAGEHQMVEYGAVECFGRGGEPAGRPKVGVARLGIPAWVIVSQHDTRTAVSRCIADDFPEREAHPRLVTFVARDVQAACLVVDMRDPQTLAASVELFKTAGEETPSGRETIQS